MKRRPLILICLLVTLPLGVLTWAGLRLAANEQIVQQSRYRGPMEDRLADINTRVNDYFQDLERSLNHLTAIDDFEPSRLRQLNRRDPRLMQLFVLSPRGQLQYPNPTTDLNRDERLFLIQAASMFTGQDLQAAVQRVESQSLDAERSANSSVPQAAVATRSSRSMPSAPQRSGTRSPSDSDQTADAADTAPMDGNRIAQAAPVILQAIPQLPTVDREAEQQQEVVRFAYGEKPIQNLSAFASASGWFVWYWDRGINLIYWQRRSSGHIVGCALERARWMSDLVTLLPDTVTEEPQRSETTSLPTRIRMINASGAAVYQWGTWEPPDGARPISEVPLAEPLAAWRLQCFVPIDELITGTGRSARFSLVAGLIGMSMASLLIVWFFLREYAQDMRRAASQVSFVNQVSHELRTPLTNIRMYAELLERDLDQLQDVEQPWPGLEKSRQRLGVILSEGSRLTRLIANVLTFARHQRKRISIQPQQVRPDELISDVVERFRPGLEDAGVRIELNRHCTAQMNLDGDVLDQILGNLISN
ncbi:MAG: HAMP domain-containing histidine kinase, partial [Planctomycetaceae bacterium]|nr:HAMP domain-containing histidine kinase [Planctomycetaceae bacterium]